MANKMALSDTDYMKHYESALPDSVRRAKWMQSEADRPQHDGQTLATRNHDVIRRWAEDRGARPATIQGTEHEGRAGSLRFDFPGGDSGGRLQQIDWDQWFESFDDRDLVMLFQETTSNGKQSNFFVLNNPKREDG